MELELRAIGILAALGSAASWALGSILFKRLGESLSPLAMTLAKSVISVLLLGLALLFTGIQGIDRGALLLLIVSGLLGIALGDTFFFAALQNLSPHTLVLLLMLGQVLTAIIAVIFLGETPTINSWIGIILVILGITTVLNSKLSGEQTNNNLRGIIFGLLSVICMSVSLVIAKKGLESISAIQATFIRMLSGTTGMLFFGLATQKLQGWITPLKQPKLASFFLFSVCVVTFGGFWLSLVAIKHLDVAVANTLNSTEPIFILPLAAIFLKEKIQLNALCGTLIASTGIVLLCNG